MEFTNEALIIWYTLFWLMFVWLYSIPLRLVAWTSRFIIDTIRKPIKWKKFF